jgi:hypothetical protein
MRLEQFRLVVHPEHGFRRLRHGGNIQHASSRPSRSPPTITVFSVPRRGRLPAVRLGAQIFAVLLTAPPYALAPTNFRFPALASLAGRAPLGGQREVVMATYVVARLAHDTLAARGISVETRTNRVAHARTWLASLALPAPARAALQRAIEASAAQPPVAGDAMGRVLKVIDAFLDPASRLELTQLVTSLTPPA